MNADANPKTMDDLRECLFASERDPKNGYYDDPDPVILGHAIQHIEDMRRALREFAMTYDTSCCHWYGGRIYSWWEENAKRVAEYVSLRLGIDEVRESEVVHEGNAWRLGKSKVEHRPNGLGYAVYEPARLGTPEEVIDLIILLRLVLDGMWSGSRRTE